MTYQAIPEPLRSLNGPDSAAAWREFLVQFSPVLQQVIVLSVDDPDSQGDCFVFACEQLAENRFRRLRKFDPSGSASFATWLRAVVRNLCIDWRRKNCGRFQPFGWTAGLDSLDQQVFHSVYEQGCSIEHTFACLAPVVPGLTLTSVEESAEHVGARLSPRERWLLSSRQVHVESLDADSERGDRVLDIPDLAPDPERAAMDREYQKALAAAIGALPAAEQLLLRMRFEQDLTLAEIARVAGMKDAQTADRKIHDVLDQVRGRMAGFFPRLPGKTKAASV
jgi:RNA polymerase sigma factor (sigma-70 family)